MTIPKFLSIFKEGTKLRLVDYEQLSRQQHNRMDQQSQLVLYVMKHHNISLSTSVKSSSHRLLLLQCNMDHLQVEHQTA